MDSNILHSSTDPTLLDQLNKMLLSAERADIAVGYFFISGFHAVADAISHPKKIRILIGRTDLNVLEEVAAGLQQADAIHNKLQQDATVRRQQYNAIKQDSVKQIAAGVAGLPQEEKHRSAVKKLRDMIASGQVKIRAYLRSPMHAKAYLCWFDIPAVKGSAIVGSSNFTLAGFRGNTELNINVTANPDMDELERWFNGLWADSADLSDDLISELDKSWALAATPPYHVYLKALYELYGSEIGLDPNLSGGHQPADLSNFQIDAVRRALGMIESYGGCYIGDVVGLGKTFIGAELLRQLKQSYPNDGLPLILCPAGLKPMWERFNEQFSLGAEVISHTMIGAPPEVEFDEEEGRYIATGSGQQGIILQDHYQNRGPVLVDEAHNFRNINRRSAGLRSYLDAGDHKVVLLSATPQNLGPRDIYRQIRLFLDEEDHGLNLDPIGLEDYFRNAEKWYSYQADLENYKEELEEWECNNRAGAPPIQPPKPTVPRADVGQVLTPIFIRRRRRDIKDLYGDTAEINGEPIHFPDANLDNVQYRLDKVYAKAGEFSVLQDLIKGHKGSRYLVTNYLREQARDKPEYIDLFRARNRIARLMGVLLLKRLESSIEAFRSTLQSLSRSNRNFKTALGNGYVPIGDTATRMLSGASFDADELLEILEQEEQRRQATGSKKSKLIHSTHDFKIHEWIPDLDRDYDLLEDMFNRVKDIGPDDDDKLRSLRNFMDKPEVKSGKLLIFSEAETTIEYLYRELNPDGKDPTIARLTGSNRDNAESIVKRFAPSWNLGKRERMRGEEIRVLLATDIVSEGQNLQDCARVLNYDLHWNPVRLIQRFGRVDRIGTKYDAIYLHNMWPDLNVDHELTLTERLENRIQSFHNLIGLDSKLLSDTERLNENAMYSIYQGKELPEIEDGLDEISLNQRAIALLQRIKDENPELWKHIENLPDGIRSALKVRSEEATSKDEEHSEPQAGGMMPLATFPSASPFDDPVSDETLVLISDADAENVGVKECYAVGSNLQPRTITPAQFIAAAECQPDTPAEDLPKDTDKRVMAAYNTFKFDIGKRLGKARKRRDTKNRRYFSTQLRLAKVRLQLDETDGNDGKLQRIEDLQNIFLGDVSPEVDNKLTEIRNLKIEGDALIDRLDALRDRFGLNPREAYDNQPDTARVIRIVCSDGLV